jgi:hypothetical protein
MADLELVLRQNEPASEAKASGTQRTKKSTPMGNIAFRFFRPLCIRNPFVKLQFIFKTGH